ncbi:MAG: TetR/AcrR family transcriptional regulator [Patulibacter sp.]|nr:TetR/AcrR family transcriptional regulator [Patulibacter sp.]
MNVVPRSPGVGLTDKSEHGSVRGALAAFAWAIRENERMAPDHTPRAYGGVSNEDRRAQRRLRLMKAAGDLAAQGGRRAVTVRAVCEQAGLNQRYFYESFKSVDELLGAVFEAFAQAAFASMAAPIADRAESPLVGTERIMRNVVGLFAVAGTDSEAAIVGALGNEAFLQRRTELIAAAAELIAQGIEHLPGRGDHGPEATRIASFVIVGGVVEALVAWSAGRLSATEEQMVRYCTDVALAAANTTGHGRRSS